MRIYSEYRKYSNTMKNNSSRKKDYNKLQFIKFLQLQLIYIYIF